MLYVVGIALEIGAIVAIVGGQSVTVGVALLVAGLALIVGLAATARAAQGRG